MTKPNKAVAAQLREYAESLRAAVQPQQSVTGLSVVARNDGSGGNVVGAVLSGVRVAVNVNNDGAFNSGADPTEVIKLLTVAATTAETEGPNEGMLRHLLAKVKELPGTATTAVVTAGITAIIKSIFG